jgi:hypothetical protein
MSGHAFLSPSGLDAALGCELKIWLEKDFPNTSSPAAAEGTAAHELAAECLLSGQDAITHLGGQIEADGTIFTVDDDMASFVQQYLDHVRKIVANIGGATC